jgi:hypothetical protein
MMQMKKQRKVRQALIYIGLSCVIFLGLMSIIGTSAG